VPAIDAPASAVMVKVYLSGLLIFFPVGEPDSIEPDSMEYDPIRFMAAFLKRWALPRNVSVPQHCWHQKKHWKRWKDIPKGRLRVRCDAFSVAGIMPQPQNAKDRNQRQ
jgi:hypothetical protein